MADACSLRFLNDLLYAVTYVSPSDALLFEHWLRHYRDTVGVRLDKFAIFVDASRNESVADAFARTAIHVPSTQITLVRQAFSNQLLMRTINGFVSSLPLSAYVIWADADEFFTYPCNMAEQLAQHDIFCADMQDRLARNGTLVPLAAHPADLRT
eukprot:6181794-Prymnesium_polylepis.1